MFLVLIFASLLGDAVALSFGFAMMFSARGAKNLAKYATPFAAGALLAAVSYDLLPDAARNGNFDTAAQGLLAGILLFFVLERFIHFTHHHTDENHAHEDKTATIPLIFAGNILHRAIDGVAIAAGFLGGIESGILITLAIAIHEIPHTIGDFGLLLYKKLSRKNVAIFNVSVAIFTTLIAAGVYLLGEHFALPVGYLQGLTAGFFIYIAVSDIIPDIHAKEKTNFMGVQSILLIVGAVFVAVLMTILRAVFGNA
jgi:zinc and cadmium transporter